MELKLRFKLGSVWLLLSCSLQQSLWGILASVPKTQAERCQVSSDGEPLKKVQMIRRIPARCSGWDEAWSWISNVDCRTKYVYDFVELPGAVEKVDVKDCKEENDASAKKSSWSFNVSNEKFLAIVLGSATVALLVLIGIIVLILVFWRGHARCSACSSGPSYTSANVSEQENGDETRPSCNEYTMEGFKNVEPVYEECRNPNIDKQKLGCCDNQNNIRYQNIPELSSSDEKSCADFNDSLKSGSLLLPQSSSPVIPSAPYEEDLQQTERKCVLNEYNSFDAAITHQQHLRSAVAADHELVNDRNTVNPIANTNGALPKMMNLKEENVPEASNGKCSDVCINGENDAIVRSDMNTSANVECIGQNESCCKSVESGNEKLQKPEKAETTDAKLTNSVVDNENVYHNFEDLVQDTENNSMNAATHDPIMSPLTCERDTCILKSAAMVTEPVYENEYETDGNTATPSSSQQEKIEPMVLALRESQTVTLHSLPDNATVHQDNSDSHMVQSADKSLT